VTIFLVTAFLCHLVSAIPFVSAFNVENPLMSDLLGELLIEWKAFTSVNTVLYLWCEPLIPMNALSRWAL